jgi:hypothetical protein
MNKLYLIKYEGAFNIKLGKSEKSILNEISKNCMNKSFLTFVNYINLDDSLFKQFFKKCDGSDLIDPQTKQYNDFLLDMNDKVREKYIYKCIKQNVKVFYKNKPRFARMYLRKIKSLLGYILINIDEQTICFQFSKKFYQETYKLFIQNDEDYIIDEFNSFDEVFQNLMDTCKNKHQNIKDNRDNK